MPLIYHITHVSNLEGILRDGFLWSDRERSRRSPNHTNIGMSSIKESRLRRIIPPLPAITVGDCVPFNFCARSVMLFLIFRRNHPELTYRGGQEPILTLEFDGQECADEAHSQRRNWCFATLNAADAAAEFLIRWEDLDRLDWAAIHNEDFRDSAVKSRKQAEFLVQGRVPARLIRRIGAQNQETAGWAQASLARNGWTVPVEVRPEWYY